MSLETFAAAYNQLTPGEQSQFAEAVRHLLSDGIIWRGEERDRRTYHFLQRYQDLVTDYLRVGGWELRHHERANIFHVVHRDGSHRVRLSRDTTMWVLLVRMIYAERRESIEVSLTRYPTITIAELYRRYTEFFPGQAVRKKTSLEEALRMMQSFKLIRAGEGGRLQMGNGEAVIELLPALEIVMPAYSIAQITERLAEYRSTKSNASEEGEG